MKPTGTRQGGMTGQKRLARNQGIDFVFMRMEVKKRRNAVELERF